MRCLDHLAEHLRRAGLVETRLRMRETNRLEQARHAEGGELSRQHRLTPGGGDEALGGEVVDFVRFGVTDDGREGMLVEEVGRHDVHTIKQMADTLVRIVRRAAHHPDHLVALRQQQLGEVGAVLPGDAGDDGRLTGRVGLPLPRVLFRFSPLFRS